jgi:hypothetical protein
VKTVAGGSAKWLDVSAERFPGWISSFARRHGDSVPLSTALADGAVTFTAPDGAVAECHPPYPESLALPPGLAGPDEIAAVLAAHARAPRVVGVLLVRLGGYAAGVFTGYPPALADSKVGSRLVHGRSAAGGWSQQRFARRRENQARAAAGDGADIATRLLVPAAGGLAAVVTGGDRRAVEAILADPRLAPVAALRADRFLTVAEPRLAALEGAVRQARSVLIRLVDPEVRASA